MGTEVPDLEGLDDEEPEVRGTLVFKPAVEILPNTKRTEEIRKQKNLRLQRKKEELENLRRMKENEQATKLRAERDAKRNKEKLLEKQRELERKRAEEEKHRKKMEGSFGQIMLALASHTSAPHITACGIQNLSEMKLRLLTKNMATNRSCQSLDLNRKGLTDEVGDGESLANMLMENKYLQKLECEGNNLGVDAATKIGEALKNNTTLRSLNLESNNLTASGNDQQGVIKLAEALEVNKSLRVLMLSKNGITAQAGDRFVKAIEANDMLTLVDLSNNDQSLSVEQLRAIDRKVQRNRERASAIRRAERRERFALYNEEFKCRQYYMQVEAKRLEIEAHEERRLNRMKARFDKWVEDVAEDKRDVENTIEELIAEAEDREANKAKNKGKKKKR